ncbi:OmpA family protein [Coprobacter tertius]|uniref:OmpA-like domain-containing protein n=1 Tax=Coprobacter tertius TaxID=2944915 RepID=A0ABT1MJG1_9BACT|nr:OmpA family protein [Coprobacter tertius]MCP9612189.1 hypothetical protein [Coprobacter tertius]
MKAKDRNNDDIRIGNKDIFRSGNYLNIGFSIDYSQLNIGAEEQMMLRPILINGLDTLRLPFVLFTGKIREKVNHRQKILYDKQNVFGEPYRVIPLTEDRSDVNYTAKVNFKNWMYGSKLYLMRKISGCAECNKELGAIPVMQFHKRPLAYFAVPFSEPKVREKLVVARLNFHQGSAVLNPEFDNNAIELSTINAVIDTIVGDTAIVPQLIALTGYASPEGNFSYNTRLSEKRAEALKHYLINKRSINEDLFTVGSESEDWLSVRQKVDSSEIPLRNEIISIIDMTDHPDARDEKIRNLDGGYTYRYLLNNIYPLLRRVECKFQYRIMPFTVESGKIILKYKPEQLNMNELYQIASTYSQGSSDFNNIIEISYDLYPQNVFAHNNMAAIAINNGDYIQARNYLVDFENDPVVQNNLGVLLLYEGDWKKALKCFEEAEKNGCKEASYNRNELMLMYK